VIRAFAGAVIVAAALVALSVHGRTPRPVAAVVETCPLWISPGELAQWVSCRDLDAVKRAEWST
jgi:hypothetical protein